MMDLGEKVGTALRWSTAARLAGMGISWIMTIIVLRLLSPSDYGVLAMATLLPSAFFLLNDLGLDVVLVQNRQPGERLLRQVFGVVVLINLLSALVLVLAAPMVASFFAEPLLVPILHVLSLQFVVLVFDTLPRAKLVQRLDFRSQSVISVTSTWLGGVVTLALAWTGFGVWALVWGRLVSTVTHTIGLNLVAPSFHWPMFSLTAVPHALSFGSIVTLERAAWQLFNDADKVIGGKLWSGATLGLYTVAQDLATMPMHRTGGLIVSIGLSAFSQVQDRLNEVRFYLLKATRITSVISFPLFFGLALTAPEAVALMLGPQWQDAVPILRILALIMPLRMVTMLLSPVLWGIARPGLSATNMLIAAVVIPSACLVGAQWGAVGMATAWLAAYPLVFLVTVRRSGAAMALKMGDFVEAMQWPALASLAMAAAVIGMRWVLPGSTNMVLGLLVLVPVGALAYVGALLAFHRSSIRETLLLVRQ
jgi:O-antigen/teichoic acid export membrane protein